MLMARWADDDFEGEPESVRLRPLPGNILLPSCEAQLKPLFSDCYSPLRSRALVNELKIHLLVKVPCGIETRKGPKVNATVIVGATEVDSGADESSSNAFPAQVIGHYEPSKMRAGIYGVVSVDRDRAFDSTRRSGNPESVAKFIITAEEFRESFCDLSFE